jgi:hypothetical protein|tara:strand:- start:772 stop:975 length:204 start_codon:yes stop_codon:yes gene_type:complete
MKRALLSVVLLTILLLLVVSCKSNTDTRSVTNPQSPPIGGGCGVAPTTNTPAESNQEMRYVKIEASL